MTIDEFFDELVKLKDKGWYIDICYRIRNVEQRCPLCAVGKALGLSNESEIWWNSGLKMNYLEMKGIAFGADYKNDLYGTKMRERIKQALGL